VTGARTALWTVAALATAAATVGVILVVQHATAPGPQVVTTVDYQYFKGEKSRVACVPRGSAAPVATWRVPDPRAVYLVPGDLCPTGDGVEPEDPPTVDDSQP
jgi:hypothetical protein